jgi:hypothetical protein
MRFIKWFFILFQSLICFSCHSQHEKIIFTFPAVGCSYYGEEITGDVNSFSSSGEAENIIKNILAIVGLKPNFEIRAADVPNAAAVIYNSKRYVLYNPRFIANLNRSAGNNWASVSILAHEIGHHLNGHTLNETGSRPDIELEADEFSGFVLRKMGASLNDSQIAMKIAADVKASHTHPGKADRLQAIQTGWENADNQMAGRQTIPKTNPRIEKPAIVKKPAEEMNNVLAEKYIAYDVQFTADPGGKYYVTIRNHLVKVEDNTLYIAGIMAESNRKKFAGMFYDKHYNYLYITETGAIVNGAGKKVGTLNKHTG